MPGLLVAGFHRSGTSMLAEMLQGAGVFMGELLIPANEFNPRGHFEDIEIVAFHDRILERLGTDWLYFGEAPLGASVEEQAQMLDFARARALRSNWWGFKDPRASLFLDQWLEAVNDTSAIVTYRHWAECSASLYRRHAAGFLTQPESADAHLAVFKAPNSVLRSWLTYNRMLLDSVRRFRERVVVIPSSTSLGGMNSLALIARKLGTPASVDSSDIFQPDLVHHQSSQPVPGDLPAHLRASLDEAWSGLQGVSEVSVAEAERPIEIMPTLSELEHELASSSLEHLCPIPRGMLPGGEVEEPSQGATLERVRSAARNLDAEARVRFLAETLRYARERTP